MQGLYVVATSLDELAKRVLGFLDSD